MIKLVTSLTPRTRSRVRRVDENGIAVRTRQDALASKQWQARVINGGHVRNSYGYRAYSEVALAVSDPSGFTVVWLGVASCNGALSDMKSANTLVPGTGELFHLVKPDGFVSALRRPKVESAWTALKAAHMVAVPALAVLGAALDGVDTGAGT